MLRYAKCGWVSSDLSIVYLSFCLCLTHFIYINVYIFFIYCLFSYFHVCASKWNMLCYSIYIVRFIIFIHTHKYYSHLDVLFGIESVRNNTNGLRLFFSLARSPFFGGTIDNKCVELRTMHSLAFIMLYVYQLGRSIEKQWQWLRRRPWNFYSLPLSLWFKTISLSLIHQIHLSFPVLVLCYEFACVCAMSACLRL